ncbi:MAG: hypothetical protein WC125_08465 [Bacteroidales bacterium]
MEPITTQTIISGKVYCVTAECSTTATETVEKKLERLICRHVSDTNSYQTKETKTLDMSEIVCEYTTDNIVKE